MAVPWHLETSFNDLDIDPNSTLVIRICIKSIAQCRSQTLFTDTAATADHLAQIDRPALLAQHTTSRGKAKPMHGDMTQDRVLSMSPDELASLHKRVQQLELSNYGLLRRIYGAQISAAPYVQFNGHDPSTSSNKSDDAYRALLFEQYQKMMAIARDPRMPDLEPATAEGARLLQLFLSEYARLTSLHQGSPQHHSPVSSPTEHKLKIQTNHGRSMARVDKKATQAYKARLEQLNAGVRVQSTALTDYQMQLMILEEQNQKRLAIMRSQRENNTAPPFDPMLYKAQLAALKALNHRQLERESVARVDVLASPVDTDDSMNADTEMSDGSSIVLESIENESPRGRQKPIKLPSRTRKHRQQLRS